MLKIISKNINFFNLLKESSYNSSKCVFTICKLNFSSLAADKDENEPVSSPKNNMIENSMRRLYAQQMKRLLHSTDQETKAILEFKMLTKYPLKSLTFTVNLLLDHKVTRQTIIDYTFLLIVPPQKLKFKLMLLAEMNPRDINDFAPLIKMSLKSLEKLLTTTKKEASFVPGGNRVYYFSDRLHIDPILVSKYFATHTFMFEISYEMLVENLNVFLSYEVKPINILKDLWAFRYLPSSIIVRLERAKVAKKEKIMPWMVRCPEEVLQKSIQLTAENRALLGGNETVVHYLAERLGFTVEVMKYVVQKHPAVLRVRVTKVKEILDYLLNEAGFEGHHIAQVPRILCHGLETTKKRLEELHTVYGYKPSTLVTLCKSQREYDKLLNTLTDSAQRRQKFSKANTTIS